MSGGTSDERELESTPEKIREPETTGIQEGSSSSSGLYLQSSSVLDCLYHKAQETPNAKRIGLVRISLDDYGWVINGAKRREIVRASGNRSLFTLDASNRLIHEGEGQEAIVYSDPSDPENIIKIYPKNDRLRGYGLGHEYRRVNPDGTIRVVSPRSNHPSDLFAKLKVIDALGLPTAVTGITEEGDIIVRQQSVDPGFDSAESVTIGDLATRHTLYEIPEGIFDYNIDPEQSAVVMIDGRFWLLDDLHTENFARSADGTNKIIDAVISEIPQELIRQVPKLEQFLGRIQAPEEGV